jgi:hypothetical protein
VTTSDLPRNNPLVRKTPMPRGDAQLRRTAMKPHRPTVTSDERTARQLLRARSLGLCEIRLDDICTGRATDWSHRESKGVGGKWRAANGLDACRQCHRHITEHPALAYEHGWFVRSHQDPADVLVLIHNATTGHDWVLLDDNGDLAFAPFPASATSNPLDLDPPRGTSAAPDTAA